MRLFAKALIFGSFCRAAFALAFPNSTTSSPTTTSTQPSVTSISIPNDTTCGTAVTDDWDVYTGFSTDPALRCYCITQLQNWLTTSDPPTRTMTRLIGIGEITTTFVTNGATETETEASVETDVETIVGNAVFADGDYWPGSAQPPCCSSCTVQAATVNLFYWPTPPIPSAATSFVSNNFTFVSPTVYIGFTSLDATDLCGPVGKSYISTTIAFGPDELSSVGPNVPKFTTVGTFTNGYFNSTISEWFSTTQTTTMIELTGGPPTAINYQDLGQNCSTISGYEYVPNNPSNLLFATNDPCHPTIILPPRVQSVDPAWVSCVNNGIGGFYDPPYALTAVQALLPPTSVPPAPVSTPQPILNPTNTAPTTAPAPVTSNQVQSAPSPPKSPSIPNSSPPPPPNPSPSVDPNSQTVPPPLQSTQPANGSPSNGLPGSGSPQNLPPIVVGGTTITANSASQYIIGSQTLSPGGPAITAAGSTFSLAPSGADPGVVVNGVTQQPAAVTPAATIVVGGSTITANSASQFIIGSQTLSPGGPAITAAGSTLSLAPSGAVVINGVTQQSALVTTAAAIVVGGSTITANSASQFVIGSQTLVPGGPALTIGSSTFSLPATGSVVVINGVTTALGTITETEAGGMRTTTSPSSSASGPAILTTNAASSSAIGAEVLFAAVAVMVGGLAVWL